MSLVTRWLLLSLLLAPALGCGGGGDDDDGGDGESWQVVGQDQPAALLSVWGTSAQDVWAVGGDPGDGQGPLVLHYDGSAWTRLDSGKREADLWWVFGFEGGPVFMSGDGGTILRYEDGEFTPLETPGLSIVFGMWGAAPDDLWAVGGNLGGGSGFVWRFDGETWAEVEQPEEMNGTDTVWKVSGLASDDVWMSATAGKTLHWNGASLDFEAVPGTDASFTSIAGNSERFVAVGGQQDGAIYENAGEGWEPALSGEPELLTGVAVSSDAAYAVGRYGRVLRRESDGWTGEPQSTEESLHAVWIDPDGGVWAVGGNFEISPTSSGVMIHKGDSVEGSLP